MQVPEGGSVPALCSRRGITEQFLQQCVDTPGCGVNIACQTLDMVRRQIRVYKHLGGAVNGRQGVAQIVQN
jgi:hypothetical protein